MAGTIRLDTTFLILASSPSRAEGARLAEWLSTGRLVRISAIAWAEFLCGPVASRDIDAAARLTRRPMAFAANRAASAHRREHRVKSVEIR